MAKQKQAPKIEAGNAEQEAQVRREFIKKVGIRTAAIPAVTLLLAATARQASGQSPYGGGDSTGGCGSGSS